MQGPVPQPAGITLRLNRKFAAAREKVFRAWTEPEILKRWWCPPGWDPAEMQVDLRAGGSYRLGMRPAAGGQAVYVRGQFIEVRAPEKLVYTWRWEGAFEGMPESRIEVRFLESEGGTEVVLVHDNLPDVELWQQHRSGWIAACDRMERDGLATTG